MKRILVTGAAGQIGSELVPELRKIYGSDNVVAASNVTPLPDDIRESGPSTTVNVTDYGQIDGLIKKYDMDTLYHLGSILSVSAEQNRRLAYQVNITGLYNILEAAKDNNLQRIIVPSSIAAFGPDTPLDNTPNETIQRPNTIYGISKVFGELMGDYYFHKFGLDVRGVRLPGIISWKTEPTAGTTDYAMSIFYSVIREQHYNCYLKPDTRLPMMYMPDAIEASIQLMEADPNRLIHRNAFNVTAMHLDPQTLADEIKKHIPNFTIEYKIDQDRESIAQSWPRTIDDSVAKKEWDWSADYDLDRTINEYLQS